MTSVRIAAIGVMLAAACLSNAALADGPDTDWAGEALGTGNQKPIAGGPVTVADLLNLRDIGGMSVSPDGRLVAFNLRQGNLGNNIYSTRWFIQPTDGSNRPHDLGIDGGQPIPIYLLGHPQAAVPDEAAQWSPDGRFIAFRRLESHRIELWRVEVATGVSEKVADGLDQVVRFGWIADGTLVYKTGLNYGRYVRNLELESRRGWLLDSRVAFVSDTVRPAEPDCSLPLPDKACSNQHLAIDPGGGTRPATELERVELQSQVGKSFASGETGADDIRVSVDVVDQNRVNAVAPLRRITIAGKDARRCADAACMGGLFHGVGWARQQRSVWFLKSEDSRGDLSGAPGDESALYEWVLASGEVRTIVRGTDLLRACQIRDTIAYCLRETATRPRHIVKVELDEKVVTVLADPNPSMAEKMYPQIRRMRIVDSFGNHGFADLVFPNDYISGNTYPLVVVQYRSKGFLRGGTGNEYPIFPLANEGMFVLSIDRPEDWEEYQFLTGPQIDHFDYQDDLRGRRRQLAAIDSAIASLIAEGLVDESRIAITGLSAGAEVVHHALQYSDRYATAIASSGAHDRTFLALPPEGPLRDRLMATFEADTVVPDEKNALSALAWSRRPHRLRVPLLVNVGDHEARLGFEGLEALKNADRPIEIRVFPDEQHIKYHPQTYAGIFANNMNWLSFWLLGREEPLPELEDQYVRWRKMRSDLDQAVIRD